MTGKRWKPFVGRAPIAFALVPTAWCVWFMTGSWLRTFCGVGCLVFTGLAAAFVLGRARRAFLTTGLVVAVLAISPVEIALAARPGLPGIVPVLRGLPGPTALERARRGEVVLAGCVVTDLEPRWVLVW
jgi:hypothetical protein